MLVTILGYFLIPSGIILLFVRPKYLLYAAVVFSGFTGSAVMIIGGDLAIQPSYWFAILWLIYRLCTGNIQTNATKRQMWNYRFLLLFVIYATASIILPVILLGKTITIMDVDGNISDLKFSSTCITQLIYLWFSFVFLISISVYLGRDRTRIKELINCYLFGASLVCIVCVYQVFSFRLGLPFDTFFRQNLHGNIQGTRIYGPTQEASMLCYYLITILPISIRRRDAKSFILSLAVIGIGIYSYSSSFIVGMIFWILLEIILAYKKGKFKISANKLLLGLAGFLVVIIVAAVFWRLVEHAWGQLASKLARQNDSGTERSETLLLLIKAFSKSPIFGVGFGTCRGKDLFSTWTAEVGLIGMGLLLIELIRMLMLNKGSYGLKLSSILVWFVMMISVPEPYNLFIWIIYGLLAMESTQYKKTALAHIPDKPSLLIA